MAAKSFMSARYTVVFTTASKLTPAAASTCSRFENTCRVSGLRGNKGSVYEGGLRVPFIARWPGHIQPSTTTAWEYGPIAFGAAFVVITSRI